MLNSLLAYDYKTIILYILIVFLATLFAILSQSKIGIHNKTEDAYRNNNVGYFTLSFLVLAFFAGTTGVGADREAYKYFFRISAFGHLYEYYEPGFRVLMGIVKLFTDNDQFFISLLSVMTVVLTYKGIWDCRNEISVGLAVFIYASQYYFQGYNLMRMYFAMSILIAGAKFLCKGQYIKYLIIIAFSALFHYSMIFVAIAYILGLWIMKSKFTGINSRFCLLLLIAVISCLYAAKLVAFLLSYNSVMAEKYSMYIENIEGTRIGFKLFFNLIPYILAMYFSRYTNKKREILSLAGAYLIITLVVSVMSYSITIAGRILLCLHMPVMILLPMGIEGFYRRRKQTDENRLRISVGSVTLIVSRKLMNVIVASYFAFSFILYLSGYVGLDGLDNFTFFWNTPL